jgi:hypothetical protein
MKKLSIVLLALVVGVFFAGTAMAFHNGDEGTSEGALGITGKYTIDAESYAIGDVDANWYDDDMEIVLRLNQGTVTGVVDLEITDDENFDGTSKDRTGDLVDNYWVEWAAMDNLKVKIGEYGLSFGAKVLIYAKPAAHHIGVTYQLDAVDLGFYLGKVDEGAEKNDDVIEDDVDSISLLVNVKSVDFFSKLAFLYVTQDDSVDNQLTYIGFDSKFMAGPVAVNLEYGSVGSDDATYDGGNFLLAQIGLDDVVGFDFNVDYFSSSEEFDDTMLSATGGDFYPYMIVTFRSGFLGDLNECTLIGLSGSYAINDKMTLVGKVLASGTYGVDDDSVGTEIDAHLKYKFDDNVNATFTVATWSGGDASDDSATDLRARFAFKF